MLLFGVGSVGKIDRKLDPLTTVVNGYIHFAVYYIPAPANSLNYLIFVPAKLIKECIVPTYVQPVSAKRSRGVISIK